MSKFLVVVDKNHAQEIRPSNAHFVIQFVIFYKE